jgi:hypothetical protein
MLPYSKIVGNRSQLKTERKMHQGYRRMLERVVQELSRLFCSVCDKAHKARKVNHG